MEIVGRISGRKVVGLLQARRGSSLLPVVVFDMAFRESFDNRKLRVVSGAAMALSAVLREKGIADPFFLSSPFVQGGNPQELNYLKNVARERPIIFALSLYDRLFEATQQEVRIIKEKFPEAKIIIGGPSVNTSQNLRDLATFFPEASALVKGEGELIITDLVSALLSDPTDKRVLGEMRVSSPL